MATLRPRPFAWLTLVALLPVAAFLLDRSAPMVGLSLVSVVLIGASVYLMLAPSQAAAAAE